MICDLDKSLNCLDAGMTGHRGVEACSGVGYPLYVEPHQGSLSVPRADKQSSNVNLSMATREASYS